MTQLLLPDAFRLVAFAFLGLLALVVGIGLLNGSIITSGLCSQKSGNTKGQVSAERVQLLLFTIAVAATYFASVATSTDRTTLPPVDGTWLAVGAGSNGIYAIGKTIRFALNKWNEQKVAFAALPPQREPAP